MAATWAQSQLGCLAARWPGSTRLPCVAAAVVVVVVAAVVVAVVAVVAVNAVAVNAVAAAVAVAGSEADRRPNVAPVPRRLCCPC